MSPPKSFRALVGVPASQPTPQNSILVIVDAQNEYDHGALACHDVKTSRAVIEKVLHKYRDAGGDVVHVVQGMPEGAPLFTPGTELAEEFEELKPKGGEEAHVCVSATSRIGAELGYDVSVVRDAIGDRDIPGATAQQLVEVGMAELGDASATIITSNDL
ncbi:MAG: hypothetical protein Q9219_005533 [cf. Caloplaca sp. 3 TL-2023]